MYVISILFIATSLLFSADSNNTAGNVTNGVNGVVNTIQTNNLLKQMNAEALLKQEAEMKAMGIEPSQCDGWRGQRSDARDAVKNKKLDLIDKISSGSCANPSSDGSAKWETFISKYQGELQINCCTMDSMVNFNVVQKAYEKYSSSCSSESERVYKCNNISTHDAGVKLQCDANKRNYEAQKASLCSKTYEKIKTEVSSKVESNCDKCKSYKSAKSSFWETFGLGTQLANLANQIFGKGADDLTEQAKLSCEQKCSRYVGDATNYKSCMCTSSYTLSDGSSQPCKMETECKEDTSCAGKRAYYEKLGYCAGEDCDDIEASCKCTEVSTAMGGATKRWDPVKRKCLDDADGSGDNTVSYTTPDNLKYTNGETSSTGKITDKSATPSGSGGAGASLPNASGDSSGTLNEKTPANEKDKSKFGTLSNKAGSQFRNSQGQNSMGEYGTSGEQESSSLSSQVPVDIVESKGPDIWRIIRDIYQTGIDANRFMGTNTVNSDKSSIKKSKKKNKGKSV